MYRTDKQFMTNPATASSRVYIGFIPKTVVAADIEEKFKVHGKILGLILQQGFAFVQYENDAQAQAAIQKENYTIMHGRKITVKQALGKNHGKGNNDNNQGQNKKPLNEPPSTPIPQQQPQQQQQQQPPPLMKPQENRQESIAPVEQEQPQIQPPPPPLQPQQQQQPPPPLLGNDDFSKKPDGNQEKRGRKRRIRSRDRFQNQQQQQPQQQQPPQQPPPPDTYRDDPYYGGAPVAPPPPVPYNGPIIEQPERNDCEIIVVSKMLTKYAEYIEQRLKALGLIVDLLFPNEDVPIGRVLANISSRGCLYAILVMPQNEEHRSLTLNVLHGIPQEHRNMPIEDALVLITRNFDAYMRGDKTASETLGSGGVMSISDRHPTPIQILLNLLAENRQLSSSQYDRLLKYLQERREVQHQHEIAEGLEQDSQESNSTKQVELQNRIMNILNKTSNESAAPAVNDTNIQTSDVAPPLLKDPSVQKALDSLLGGEMFKNITGGNH